MSIAFVEKTNEYDNATATSTTFAHTVSAGANLALLVFMALDGGFPPAETWTATYNGDSMTKEMESTANEASVIFSLGNPDVGAAQNVVVNWTNNTKYSGGASTYSGVNQSDPATANTDEDNGTATASDTSVSSANGEMCVDFITVNNLVSNISSDGGQTERFENTGDADIISTLTSDKPGAATVAMGHDWTGSQVYVSIVICLRPAFIPKIMWFGQKYLNPFSFIASIFCCLIIKNPNLTRREIFNPFKWFQ